MVEVPHRRRNLCHDRPGMSWGARTLSALGFFAVAIACAPAANAATDASEFGPPPEKACGGTIGGSGCYGSDVGPNYMDDAGNGNLFISPHVVKVGESLTMTVEGDNGDWNRTPPGLAATSSCTADDQSCTFEAIAPTTRWERYNITFPGSREQDYYGVLSGPATIEGHVVDSKGFPVPSAKVTAKGSAGNRKRRPPGLSTTTNSDGTYLIQVPSSEESFLPAEYRVSAKAKAAGPLTPKKRTVTVTEGAKATANFKARLDNTGTRRATTMDTVASTSARRWLFQSPTRHFLAHHNLVPECGLMVAWLIVSSPSCQDGSTYAVPSDRGTIASPFFRMNAGGSFSYRGLAVSQHKNPPFFEMTAKGKFTGRQSANAQISVTKVKAGDATEPDCYFAARTTDLKWSEFSPSNPER